MCVSSRCPQVSPDGLLLQSSTVSDKVRYTFSGGAVEDIAGSYVEFAERRPMKVRNLFCLHSTLLSGVCVCMCVCVCVCVCVCMCVCGCVCVGVVECVMYVVRVCCVCEVCVVCVHLCVCVCMYVCVCVCVCVEGVELELTVARALQLAHAALELQLILSTASAPPDPPRCFCLPGDLCRAASTTMPGRSRGGTGLRSETLTRSS